MEANTDGARGPDTMAEIFDWVESLLLAMLLVVLLFIFCFRTVSVDGISMYPTLQDGQGLIVSRVGGSMRQGDIVAVTKLDAINKPLIKRVIATGGQTIDFDRETGDVLVDGAPLTEPYIAEKINPDSLYDGIYPLTLPEGYIFVMGDNRNQSWDSRAPALGPMDERHVLGRVLWRYQPLSDFGKPQ